MDLATVLRSPRERKIAPVPTETIYWLMGHCAVQFLLTDFRVLDVLGEQLHVWPKWLCDMGTKGETDIQKFNSSISITMSICYGRDGFYETFLPLEEKLLITRN